MLNGLKLAGKCFSSVRSVAADVIRRIGRLRVPGLAAGDGVSGHSFTTAEVGCRDDGTLCGQYM